MSIPHSSIWHALEPFGNEKQLQSEKIQQAFYEFGGFFRSMDAWRASFYRPHEEQPQWHSFREDIQEHTITEFIPLKRSYKTNTDETLSNSIFFQGLWPKNKNDVRSYFDFSIYRKIFFYFCIS